jgi:hypothetical protein
LFVVIAEAREPVDGVEERHQDGHGHGRDSHEQKLGQTVFKKSVEEEAGCVVARGWHFLFIFLA